MPVRRCVLSLLRSTASLLGPSRAESYRRHGRRPLLNFGADRARQLGKIRGGFLIGMKLSVERQPRRFQAIVALLLGESLVRG